MILFPESSLSLYTILCNLLIVTSAKLTVWEAKYTFTLFTECSLYFLALKKKIGSIPNDSTL